MIRVKLVEDIFFVGVNDRKTHLFENYWPLDRGMAYNANLIIDEKVALIDTVERGFIDEFLEKITDVLNERPIDYLIVNHMEPDHSGAINSIVAKYPNITIVGNKKTFPILSNYYQVGQKILVVEDGGKLDLGRHQLHFYTVPMVHWPESMVTYESTEKILFASDIFGSFGALDGGIFDDEVNLDYYEEELMRYFTNVVGKYCPHTQRALKKLEDLEIKIIAPAHGLTWRSNPSHIINLYQRWSSYTTEPGVVIVYGTMYRNTERMADVIARQLAVRGIKNIRVYDSSKTHPSYIISDIFKYKGFIIGSCAYNNEMFPAVESLVAKIEHMGIKDHLLGIFGSYTWSGGGVKNLKKFAEQIGWEMIAEPIEEQGSLKTEKANDCIALANAMADKLLG